MRYLSQSAEQTIGDAPGFTEILRLRPSRGLRYQPVAIQPEQDRDLAALPLRVYRNGELVADIRATFAPKIHQSVDPFSGSLVQGVAYNQKHPLWTELIGPGDTLSVYEFDDMSSAPARITLWYWELTRGEERPAHPGRRIWAPTHPTRPYLETPEGSPNPTEGEYTNPPNDLQGSHRDREQDRQGAPTFKSPSRHLAQLRRPRHRRVDNLAVDDPPGIPYPTALDEFLTRDGLGPEGREINPVLGRSLAHMVGLDHRKSTLIRATPGEHIAATESHLEYSTGEILAGDTSENFVRWPVPTSSVELFAEAGDWRVQCLTREEENNALDITQIPQIRIRAGEHRRIPIATIRLRAYPEAADFEVPAVLSWTAWRKEQEVGGSTPVV